MIDENTFREIANEIKSMHNGALVLLKKKDYIGAISLYQRALVLTEKLCYEEGEAMSLFNIANVLVLLNDPVQAVHYAEQAKHKLERSKVDCAHCDLFLSQLAEKLKVQGIQYEKQGDFCDAIRCYTAAMPYADSTNRSAMEHEIRLLEEYTND